MNAIEKPAFMAWPFLVYLGEALLILNLILGFYRRNIQPF